MVLLWNIRGKGVGRVGGGDRPRNRQVNAQALSKLPFSNLPISFSRNQSGNQVCGSETSDARRTTGLHQNPPASFLLKGTTK